MAVIKRDWLPSPYDFIWKIVHSVGTCV